MKIRRFTLMELLFTIAILVIIIGIGLSAGTKVLRKQVEAQRNAEIVMISSAIEQYKLRWNSYPFTASGEIDFAKQLSPISSKVDMNGDGSVDDKDWEMRPLWLEQLNHDWTHIFDPYEEKYQIEVNVDGTYEVK